MVQIEAVPLAFPQSAHLLLSDNDFSGSQPTLTNVMPALEPYAKAPRHTHPRKSPARASRRRNLLMVSMPVTVGGVVAVVMVLVAAEEPGADGLSLTARSRPKERPNTPENLCRTTIAERMVETLSGTAL